MLDQANSNPDIRPLNIAFVVDRFGARYGGAEAYGVELMRELKNAGHNITVFARDYDLECDLELNFTKIDIASYWPSWIRVFLFARRAAKLTQGKFDIVHSHMNGWCGDIEVIHVVPVRFRWRISKSNIIKKWLSYISPRVSTYLWLESKRVAKRKGHKIVAVSKLILEQLNQAYSFTSQIPVIPPGVVATNPISQSEKQQLRTTLGLNEDVVLCLLVARNPMRKGLATVVKAMLELPENIHLLVVGANSASKSLVADYADQIQNRIHLVAETSNVVPYYQASDIYVHPTLNDSFGMAPLEAMSYGLPVIMSPAPWCGFADYVEANEEAILLKDPNDAAELAHSIELLNTNANLYLQLVDGAKNVVSRHTWSEVARHYQSLYGKVLSEKESA